MSFQHFITKLFGLNKEPQLDKITPKLSINDAELGNVNNIIWNSVLHYPELDLELGLPLKQYMQNININSYKYK